MKNTKTTIMLALLLIAGTINATGPIKDGAYAIDTNASSVVWTGSKITGSSHTGTVKIKSGEFAISQGVVKSGEFTLDMTTIETTDLSGNMKAKLEKHLLSEDFFDVANHKSATIVVIGSESHGDHIQVTADLTIKGTTRPVTFDMTLVTEGSTFTASSDIVVDRSEYDVRYGSDSFFDDLGNKAINNDIKFNLTLKGKTR